MAIPPFAFQGNCSNSFAVISKCKTGLRRGLSALGAWCFLCLPISAQPQTSLDELLQLSFDEIIHYEVVTPTKSGTPLSEIPGAVSVITYQDIQRSAASTIPDLLRLVPGVSVRWNPMVQTIDIRSFGSNPFTSKILLMIDGIPYNSWNKGGFPQHPGFDFFNLDNVKHIEVVRGPGSTLYGENALNGIINIVTFSGEEFDATRAKLYSGDSNTRAFSITRGKRVGNAGSTFISVRASEGQLPLELWRDSGAESRSYDLFAKGKFRGLQLSYYRKQDSFDGFLKPFDSPELPPDTVFRSAEKIEQNINILAAQFNYASSDDKWSSQSNASFSNRQGSHCASCHSPSQSDEFLKKADHGYQYFINSQLAFRGIAKHDISMGVEHRRISSGQHHHEFGGSDETGGHVLEKNVTHYKKSAIFAQDIWQLPNDRWRFIYSARYDTDTSPDLLEGDIFPRLALVGQINSKTTVRFNWSQSARYPSFTELYQDSNFLVAESPGLNIRLAKFSPTPELVAEKVTSYEFGLSYSFSTTAQLRVDFFQNKLVNSIVVVYPREDTPPPDATISFENHPNDARIQGVEVDFKANPTANLATFFNWSYQHNEALGDGVDSQGRPLEFTYSPKHKVNFGFTYSPQDDFRLTMDGNWRGEYVAPSFWYPLVFGSSEVAPLEDYLYLNLKLTYMPKISGKRPLTISVISKNLLDEEQYETLVGIGGKNVGRQFFVGLTYEWPL